MRIAVVTLFPVMIREALAHGVVGRAVERGVLEVECFDPRDHAADVHRTVDDRSYGGGQGCAAGAKLLWMWVVTDQLFITFEHVVDNGTKTRAPEYGGHSAAE